MDPIEFNSRLEDRVHELVQSEVSGWRLYRLAVVILGLSVAATTVTGFFLRQSVNAVSEAKTESVQASKQANAAKEFAESAKGKASSASEQAETFLGEAQQAANAADESLRALQNDIASLQAQIAALEQTSTQVAIQKGTIEAIRDAADATSSHLSHIQARVLSDANAIRDAVNLSDSLLDSQAGRAANHLLLQGDLERRLLASLSLPSVTADAKKEGDAVSLALGTNGAPTPWASCASVSVSATRPGSVILLATAYLEAARESPIHVTMQLAEAGSRLTSASVQRHAYTGREGRAAVSLHHVLKVGPGEHTYSLEGVMINQGSATTVQNPALTAIFLPDPVDPVN